MSDISIPLCTVCGHVLYDCQCPTDEDMFEAWVDMMNSFDDHEPEEEDDDPN